MRAKLLTTALAALLLAGNGLAMADNDGRGKRHGGGEHRGAPERGWDRSPPHWNPGPPHSQSRHPYAHRGWQGRGYGHGHWRPAYPWRPHPGWRNGHGPQHYGGYAKPHGGYGDDITIIFRGRLD